MKKIVIAGGTGFLGSLLNKYFTNKGYHVIIFTRSHHQDSGNTSYVKWDGQTMGHWVNSLEHAEAIINLNGKSVDCRYTASNREEIYDSRINATLVLGKAIQQCDTPPKVWINAASATIYPHSLDKPMTEAHQQFANDFSVDVCKKWESAFNHCRVENVRKVLLRVAIVLGSGSNSALSPLKKIARIGLGGQFGNGQQMMSWLHQEDFVSIVDFCLSNDQLSGIYNASAPCPVTNQEFCKVLRRTLNIPFGLPIPTPLLKIGGLMIQTEPELILKSRYVLPARLTEAGFVFKFPEIVSCLADLCDASHQSNELKPLLDIA